MYRNQDCKMLQGKSNLVIKIQTVEAKGIRLIS